MDDLISREKLLTEIEEMNIASFWEENEHSAEVYREVKQLIKSMDLSRNPDRLNVGDSYEMQRLS